MAYVERPQVVIIGGGFGGLSAAQALKSVPVDVTLIDRRNFHLFQPLLYQVVGTLVAFAETLGLLTAHAEDRAHPGRNVWCCPRNVRAGFMVDRCSSVWVETHRTFPSQELAIIPERD
ncbi:MAG TPA: FAD-dependent oxidoreductase, partial [Acidobacteriaceae bacterium]